MLRGMNEINMEKPNAYKYLIKGVEAMFSFIEKNAQPLVKGEILKKYGVEELQAWPLHTCLFTNELFQVYFKDLIKGSNKIENKIKKEFLQDEDFASKTFKFYFYINFVLDDAFKEMINNIQAMSDNYDKKN